MTNVPVVIWGVVRVGGMVVVRVRIRLSSIRGKGGDLGL